MLERLSREPLDAGSEHFEPSSLQVTTVDVGNPATNVIPAEAKAGFGIRFNDLHDSAALERWLRETLDGVGGRYELEVKVSGESFLCPPGPLSGLVCEAVESVTGAPAALGTGGGTSDARFIKDYAPVAELGLLSSMAHKVDERVSLEDLSALERIYEGVLQRFFAA
jgi:succinyl-diaminopimelate desuccinylase